MPQRYATIAEIRACGPMLSANDHQTDGSGPFPDALLTSCASQAQHLIGLSVWGELASDGHALLSAHFAAQAVTGAFGPAGPAVSETMADGVSRTYASPTSTGSIEDDLRRTSYGVRYLQLRAIVLARHGTILGSTTSRRPAGTWPYGT